MAPGKGGRGVGGCEGCSVKKKKKFAFNGKGKKKVGVGPW